MIFPKLKSVVPTSDFRLNLLYHNGERKIYDMSRIENKGVFQRVFNPEYFSKVSLFMDGWTVTWPDGQDIAPEELYTGSVLAQP